MNQRTPTFFKAMMAIAHKDLAAEFRSRELLSAMLVFSMRVILIFNFALELDVKVRQSVTAGVLWTTFAFAGTLGPNRSMAVEKDRGCIVRKKLPKDAKYPETVSKPTGSLMARFFSFR